MQVSFVNDEYQHKLIVKFNMSINHVMMLDTCIVSNTSTNFNITRNMLQDPEFRNLSRQSH